MPPDPPKRACFRTLTFACCTAPYMCPTCARATILFWLRHCFGEGCHITASEPYYYDSAYHPVKRPSAIPINENGTCVVANEISNPENDSTKSKGGQPTKEWNCHSECKVITDTEVSAIVHLRQAFDKPLHELRSALDRCDDGCPNQHYTRVVGRDDLGWDVMNLQGNPLVCSNDGGCRSQLRILRAAATHHGVLRPLLDHVYTARTSHLGVVLRTLDNKTQKSFLTKNKHM